MAPLKRDIERFFISIPVDGTGDKDLRTSREAIDDSGFLIETSFYELHGDIPWWFISEAFRPRPLATIFDIDRRCVLLQGEYGIGKSWALRKLAEDLTPKELNWRLSLRQGIAEAIDVLSEVRDWITQSPTPPGLERPWRLLIDGLDETSEISRLIRKICGFAGQGHVQFVISGRPYAFTSEIISRLRNSFGDDRLLVAMLAPLRISDVRMAAEAEGVDADAFIQDIWRLRLSPLASKPLTLDGLLNRFKQGQMPADRWQAFEEECKSLIREPARSVAIPENSRYRTAQRTAALMRLSGREILVPGEGDPLPRPEIRSAEIIVGEDADYSSLTAILEAGLFRHDSDKRIAWDQPSYLDFMAASYLTGRELPERTLRQLLTDRHYGEERIALPLIGVGRWLATRKPQIAELLIQQDPMALLDSADLLSNELRARLVERLFMADIRPWWPRIQWEYSDNLTHLANPGLSEQLRLILDESKEEPDRNKLALKIAQYAQPDGIGAYLEQLALDTTRSLEERTLAVSYWIERDNVPPSLFGILTEVVNDPEGSLRGAVLLATWRRHMAPAQVFQFLVPPEFDIVGNVYEFVARHLLPYVAEQASDQIAAIDKEFLSAAVQWLVTSQDQHHWLRASVYEDLEAVLLSAVLVNLDRIEIPIEFATFIDKWLMNGRHLLTKQTSQGNRYPFATQEGLQECLTRRPNARRAAVSLLLSPSSPATPLDLDRLGLFDASKEDVFWFLDQVATLPPDRAKSYGGYLPLLFEGRDGRPDARLRLRSLVDEWRVEGGDQGLADWVIEVIQRREEALGGEVPPASDPAPEPQPLDPPLLDRISSILINGSSNLPQSWCNAVHLLAIDELGRCTDESRIDRRFMLDVSSGWAWLNAPPILRGLLIDAAEAFVLSQGTTYRFMIGNLIDFARIKALVLLLLQAPERITNIPEAIWGAIVPEILEATVWAEVSPSREVLSSLVAEATRRSPTAVADAILAIINHHQSADLLRQLLRFIGPHLEGTIGARITEALRSRIWPGITDASSAQDSAATAESEWSVSTALAVASALAPTLDAVRDWAFEALSQAPWSKQDKATLSTILLDQDTERAWPDVFGRMKEDLDFADLVLKGAYGWYGGNAWWGCLSLAQLEEFHIWLLQRFPPEEDPVHNGAYSPQYRDDMVSLRSRVFQHLRAWEGHDAIASMRRVAHRFPQYQHLQRAIEEMRERDRASAWDPPEPEEVARLLDDPLARLIRSEIELQAVLMDALSGFERKLKGEGLLPMLYGPGEGGKLHREERISALIAYELRHVLERQRAGIHREVQVNAGDRTDIWVQVTSPSRDLLNVIIEVKKASNEEVQTAIRDQLVNRYLKDQGFHHGIFLVLVDKDIDDLNESLHQVADAMANEGYSIQVCFIDIRK